MMNSLQADLYQRLQKFELDNRTHEFGFTRHLMKQHRWTQGYAHRAIAEYKKFAGVASTIAFITIGCATTDQESTSGQCVGALTTDQAIAIFTASVVIGLMLRHFIRRPDKQSQKPQLDVYQMAYLAGGSLRVVDLAIIQLVRQGYLHPNVRNRTFTIEKLFPSEATYLEQQLVQQVHRSPQLKSLRLMKKYKMDDLKGHLGQEKLLMTGWAVVLGLSFSPFLIILGGMLVGIFMLILGKPSAVVGTIISGFDLTVGSITLCCFVPSRRTRWGDQILKDLQGNYDIYDVTQRCALYGYHVLSGGVLEDLRQMFKAEDDEATASAAGACGGGGSC